MNTKLIEYLNCGKSTSFNEMLFSFIDEKGFSDAEVYKSVDVDRKLFSKIRCGTDYIPRKNVVIKLGLALGLNRSDFDELLKSAGYSLSNSKFDRVIAYCLDNNVYSLMDVNNYLSSTCNASL